MQAMEKIDLCGNKDVLFCVRPVADIHILGKNQFYWEDS